MRGLGVELVEQIVEIGFDPSDVTNGRAGGRVAAAGKQRLGKLSGFERVPADARHASET